MVPSLRKLPILGLAIALGTVAWMANSQDAPLAATAAPSSSVVPTAPTAKKVTSSTSSSRQFVVHGADLSVRSTFCMLSEDTSVSLGRLLKDDARFSIPIVVVLKTPPDVSQTDPLVSTSISQLTHGGFHLQVTAQLRPGFRTEDYSRELVRVLLAERILRDHQELNTSRQRVLPDWLLTGVTQAMDFRSRSKPSVLFAAVFRSGQVYSIDNILSADPTQLDALSRGIYEVSSCALVLTLLEQPDASLRFAKFLNALASNNVPDRELLQQHFPTLGISKNSLEKWWTLQMASLSTPTAMEAMTVADTEKELDEALSLEFEKSPGEKPRPARQPRPAAVNPAPVIAETPPKEEEKKSGGFFGFGKGKAEKKEEPAPKIEKEKAAPKPAAAAPAPTPEPSPEKKSGGFLGFGKGKPEPKEEKEAPEPAPKRKAREETKPSPPSPETKPAREEPAKEKPKAEKPADPKPKKGKAKEEKTVFEMLNPFAGGQNVIFPFSKKDKEDTGDTEAKPADKEKAKSKKPAPANEIQKPAEKPKAAPLAEKTKPATQSKSKPAAAPAPSPEKTSPVKAAAEKPASVAKKPDSTAVPAAPAINPELKSLPRKPAAERAASRLPEDVPRPAPVTTAAPAPSPLPEVPQLPRSPDNAPVPGSRPDDLPAVMPPLASATDKPPTPPSAPDDTSASRLNPLNWFRKDESLPPQGANGMNPPLPSDAPLSRNTSVASDDSFARYPLDEFEKIARRPDRNKILQRSLEDLAALQLRAHPLYKPLIGGYISEVQKLIQGKDKNIPAELQALQVERNKVRQKASEVESYLDWYEASEIHTYSGTFDDYLKLRDKLEKDVRPRTDAISKYLDALEKEYE